MIYYVVAILSVLSVFFSYSERKYQIIYSFALLMFSFIVVSVNYNVGLDYENYYEIYESVLPLSKYQSFGDMLNSFSYHHGEVGFLFLLALLRDFDLDFNVFIAINSLSSLFFLFCSLVVFSRNISLSVSIYMFFFFLLLQFVQIRLGFVFSIFCLLMALAFTRRYFLFSFFFVIGVLYHKVIIVSLLLIFIAKCKNLISPYVMLLLSWLIFSIKPLSLAASYFVGGGVSIDVIEHYSNDKVHTDASFPFHTYMFFLALYFFFYCIARASGDLYYKYVVNVFLVSLILWVSFSEIVIFGSRFFLIYSASLMFVIPATYVFIRSKIVACGFTFFYVSYFVLYFVRNVHTETLKFLPYNTILGV